MRRKRPRNRQTDCPVFQITQPGDHDLVPGFFVSPSSMPGPIPLDSLATIAWNSPLPMRCALVPHDPTPAPGKYRVSTGQVPGKSPEKERDGCSPEAPEGSSMPMHPCRQPHFANLLSGTPDRQCVHGAGPRPLLASAVAVLHLLAADVDRVRQATGRRQDQGRESQ